MSTFQRTVIVTGASMGIGAAIAGQLERSGWRVFRTSRRPDPARDGPDTLALDVTNDASVAAAVAEALARAGRIDAVVNNAGIAFVGAAEETTADEALAVFQTNFFGVHRLCRAVLPAMRSQGQGRLVTIGSIAGFLPTPFLSFYSAAKHAIEGYVESLDYEVRPHGVRALLIEPGFIRSNLGGNIQRASVSLDVYAAPRASSEASQVRGIARGTPSDAVARAVETVLTRRRPRLRTRVGADAHQLRLLRSVLPNALFGMGIRRQFGGGGS